MSCRQIWQDIYGIEVLPASVATLADALAYNSGVAAEFLVATHGVKGMWGSGTPIFNLLPVDAYPNLKAPYTTVEKNLATGTSLPNTASVTPVAGIVQPVSVPVVFNAHNLTLFLKLLFQDGVAVTSGTTNAALEISTFTPYAEGCPITFANLVRVKSEAGEADVVDQTMGGVVVNSITLRGEEGGLLEGDVEFIGAKWELQDLSDAVIAAIEPFDPIAPLRFEDLTVRLGDIGTGTAINVPSFEVTLSSNVKSFFYNENFVKEVMMGKFSGEGSISIPWNDPTAGSVGVINDFIAGTDQVLSLVWGATTWDSSSVDPLEFGCDVLSASAKNGLVDNYFAMHMNIKYSDYEEADRDENPMIDAPFMVIQDSADTVSTITCQTGYAVAGNSWVEP